MSDLESSAARSGYLSEDDKKRFTIVVGVLGAVFFMLQFLVPMVAMFAIMPAMMMGTLRTYDVGGGALYRDHVYLVESTQGFAPEMRGRPGSRLVKLTDEGIEGTVPLEGWRPELVADGEKLWLVSSERVATLENDRLTTLPTERPLGDICRPFLYRGAPAAIEIRPEGSRLMIWKERGWEEARALDLGRDRCAIQAVAVDDDVWVFQREGDSLFVQEATSDSPRWDVVLSRPNEWFAFEMEGRPAVASLSPERGFRIAQYDGAKWATSPNGKTEARFATSLAVFPRSDSSVVVVSETFPGSVRLQTWDGERLSGGKRFGSSFPFPPATVSLMMLPQAAMMLSSLVLAVILAWLMRTHRITTHRYGDVQVHYASLTRRALAQLLDGLVLGLPAGYLFWRMMANFEELFDAGPAFPLQFLGLWLGSLLWGMVVFLGFSVTEGYWGATPGKWALGIRVLGTDLEPCGFGRALVRNVLKLVDGFFNYLVGILLIAYTPEWQRLGDLAARTIVIRPASQITSQTPPSQNRDSSSSS